MNIERATIKTATPEKTAYLFRAVLAADKGYTSTVRREGGDWVVTASDGQAVRFSNMHTDFYSALHQWKNK